VQPASAEQTDHAVGHWRHLSRSQDARRPLSSEHRSSRLGGSNFHNLQSLKVSIPGPLWTPTRADEHLIIGTVLTIELGLRSAATCEHLTRDRCCAELLTHLPQHLGVWQPWNHYVVWRARRDSNPRPADPKSDARGSALAPLSRAQRSRPSGPDWGEISVSIELAFPMSLMPTLAAPKVRCTRHGRVSDARRAARRWVRAPPLSRGAARIGAHGDRASAVDRKGETRVHWPYGVQWP
jgi:hypothetical protein